MSDFSLNNNQQQAVNALNGAFLVVAGAGTGKTKVITERIKSLIQSKNAQPQNILALTFTEKAATEMAERVEDIMPLGYEEPYICTFHSFAERILRNEAMEIGLNSNYKIIADAEQWVLLRQQVFKMNLSYYKQLGNPGGFISSVLKFISRLKDENISHVQFSTYVKTCTFSDLDEQQKYQELAYIYEYYEDLKLKNSKLDFGDLIFWCIKLFEQRPHILKKYQNKFKHVLVDEFQDTNHAQYELVKLLSPSSSLKTRSLMVVGDDSQSIYKFRGAAISNILEFKKDYPQTQMFTLTQNYRSNQAILDSSYSLIQNNNPNTLEVKLGISKKLTSNVDFENVVPMVLEFENLESEVEHVVKTIYDLLAKEPNYTYKDIAILARSHSHLEPFLMALRKYGMPYQLVGNRGLYDRNEIRDILSLIKCIINPNDSQNLFKTLTISCLNINTEFIAELLTEFENRKVYMWDILKEKQDENVLNFIGLINEFQQKLTKLVPSMFLYELVYKTGYLQNLTNNLSIENELSIKNLNIFATKVKTFETTFANEAKENPTIYDFYEYISLMRDANDNPAQAEIEDIDTIKLLTVHASKGLEFPVVFMVNLVASRFPSANRSEAIEIPLELVKETLPLSEDTDNEHISEERRLFYVGLTRAQKYLYLTYATKYTAKRSSKASGFIAETLLTNQKVSNLVPQANFLNTPEALFLDFTNKLRPKNTNSNATSNIGVLSFSKYDTFDNCPLKYKFNYVLNVPTAPNPALVFGNCIHNCLRFLHVSTTQNLVSLQQLLDFYTQEFNANTLGVYEDSLQRDQYFTQGKDYLTNYYQVFSASDSKIMAVEKEFSIKIAGIKFIGRIDRIDLLSEQNDQKQVEIIDFKTGTAKDQEKVDSKKTDQLAFYAYAASQALNLNVSKLSYFYLDGGQKVTSVRSDKDIEKLLEQIQKVIEQIKNQEFVAKPSKYICAGCEFKNICPYAVRG